MMGSAERLEFRPLVDDELDAAYLIISNAVDWLLSKGIKQWTAPLPHSVWRKRQRDGQNYAMVCDGGLAVVLSILYESSQQWKDELDCDEHWWLSTIATSTEFRGRQMGERAIREASAFLGASGVTEFYIDCVYGSGFLQKYYESLGFVFVSRKNITYTSGIFDMVLMKMSL